MPLHELETPVEGGVVGIEGAGVIGAEFDVEELPPATDDISAPSTPAEIIVNPNALKAMRTSGAEVQPPLSLYSDRPRTTLTLVLHVNVGGEVTRVELLKSSGNPKLDANVSSTLETWRFHPWMDQGSAVAGRPPMNLMILNSPNGGESQ